MSENTARSTADVPGGVAAARSEDTEAGRGINTRSWLAISLNPNVTAKVEEVATTGHENECKRLCEMIQTSQRGES